MPDPVLVGVAHGSRDSRSAATMHALARATAAAAPGVDVRLAFLEFNAPRLADVLHAAAADGHTRAVVVPLLLGSAYHARVDVPAAVDAAVHRLPQLRVDVADVLGARTGGLLAAAGDRLRAVGADPDDPDLGVVLTAAGSSHATANAAVHRLAARLPRATAAFASAAAPTVDEALAALRAAGARRTAVLPWFLAPGRLLDRVRDHALAVDPAVTLADPLGAHPLVAAALLERYRAAAGRPAGVLAGVG